MRQYRLTYRCTGFARLRPSRHLVTARSHRSCDLLLKATRGVTIAVVSSRERKRRQPGLATDDPAFVGWHQLVRGIQGSYVHFDFVCAACENGGAAAGTEKPPDVVACFAIDRHRILREHRGSVKKGPMMLAAVETVTKADPVWESRRHNSDVAAQATARESVHAASPLIKRSECLQRTPSSVHERCASHFGSPSIQPPVDPHPLRRPCLTHLALAPVLQAPDRRGRPNAIILVDQPVRCYLDLAPALAFEMDHLAPGDVDQQGIAAGAHGLLPIGRRAEGRVRRIGWLLDQRPLSEPQAG